MIKAVGHRLLVKPHLEEETKHSSGLIIKRDRQHIMGCDEVTVIDIGPMAWKSPDLGYGSSEWKPWCEVGDKIYITKYSQKSFNHDGKEVWFINDIDVQGVVQE
jgi:co-chaperonin GroES (HSP10)